MKSKRGWLESQQDSGSWYKIDVSRHNEYTNVTFADCYRSITWEFGCPGDKRAERKIKKIKAIVDELHNHLVTSGEKENSNKKKKRKPYTTVRRLRSVV